MRKVLNSGIGGASVCGNSESGIGVRKQTLLMSAILFQLTGRHKFASNLLWIRPSPSFRISARISNCKFATASCSRTFLQSIHRRRAIPGLFTTLRHRSIFSSAPLSIRYHAPQNPRKAPRFLSFLDRIPQDFVFYGIIGINSAVFTMWYMAEQKYVSEDPSILPYCVNCRYLFNLKHSRNNKAIHQPSYG